MYKIFKINRRLCEMAKDVLTVKADSKYEELVSKYQELKNTLKNRKDDLSDLKKQLRELEKDKDKFQQRIRLLDSKIESTKKKIAVKEKNIENAAERVEKAKKAMSDARVKSKLSFEKETNRSKKVFDSIDGADDITKKEKSLFDIPAVVKEEAPVDKKEATPIKKEKAAKKETKKAEPKKEEPKAEVAKTEVKAEAKAVSDKMDVVISFDTTGSMYSVLADVRRDIKNAVSELFTVFGKDNLRIAIIAHGDYCDASTTYVLQQTEFSNNVDDLCKFVTNVERTYGGDSDECYELVLKTVTELEWRKDAKKIFIMIGDANPHKVGYTYKYIKNDINWRIEAVKLADMSVQVYGVHALHNYRQSSASFYHTVSEATNGVYLTLDNFSDVLQIISATCYKNHSEESYADFIDRVLNSKNTTRTLWDNIRRLNGEKVDDAKSEDSFKIGKRTVTLKTLPGLHVVPAGRFQVISVESADSIKGFVEKNGITYKVGKAFYELTKTEEVQQYKEIILQDKISGDMYYGDDARKHLGLKPQCERKGDYAHEKLRPVKDDEYRVFVQSTSVNRKLVAGTNLLYEVEEV